MTEISFFEILANLTRWERPRFLVFFLFSIIAIYFNFGDLVFQEQFRYNNTYAIGGILFIIILIIIYWYWSTNRLFFKGNKKVLTGVLIISEDEKESEFIRKVIKKVISEIKEIDFLHDWKIIILPINFHVEKKKIEEFAINRQSQLDNLIVIKCESGRYDNTNKILIREIGILINSSYINNLTLFSENVDPIKELKIRNINKDWVAVEDNLGNDRLKIIDNFRDLLLYYFGISQILEERFDLALSALQDVYDHQGTLINREQRSGTQVRLNERNIIAGRHRTILIELYLRIGIEMIKAHRYSEAFDMLKKGEKLFNPDSRGFSAYMNMARAAYECGKIEEAKHYTSLMNTIRSNSMPVLLNKAFLYLVEGKTKEFVCLYDRIFKNRDKILSGQIDVIEFLEREKKKHENLQVYFDFAIGVLNKLYADEKQGQNLLLNVIDYCINNSVDSDLLVVSKKIAVFQIENDSKTLTRKTRNKKKAR